MKTTSGIYIHIPYCLSKCSYCDFVSYKIDNTFAEYLHLLEQEIILWKDRKDTSVLVDSIFFGGGTPSLLSPLQLERILCKVSKIFTLTDDCEISIESNPDTLNVEKLKDYKKVGINRLSIGVQTLDDKTLKEINRRHTAAQAINGVMHAYDAGFTNINCDFILGLPFETKSTIDYNIKKIRELPITHVSTYFLTLSSDVPMMKRLQNGDLQLPTENNTIINWKTMVEAMKDMCFNHYEISNYSKVNMECRHNLHYWHFDQWFGIGIASTGSCITEINNLESVKRYTNFKEFNRYKDSIEKGQLPQEITEMIEGSKIINEKCMLGLRLINEGIPLDSIENKNNIKYFLENGYIKYIDCPAKNCFENNDSRVFIGLTEKGVLVSNKVISSMFVN